MRAAPRRSKLRYPGETPSAWRQRSRLRRIDRRRTCLALEALTAAPASLAEARSKGCRRLLRAPVAGRLDRLRRSGCRLWLGLWLGLRLRLLLAVNPDLRPVVEVRLPRLDGGRPLPRRLDPPLRPPGLPP